MGRHLPLIEDHDPNATIIDPEGFQVVEELLYTDESLDVHALKVETGILSANLLKIRQYNQTAIYTDRHVIESVRLGLIRMLSLGLSGFDSPIAKQSLRESAIVLTGLEKALAPYLAEVPEEIASDIRSQIKASQDYLEDPSQDFFSFDRLTFIRDYANPLSRSFHALNEELDIEKPTVPKPLNDTPTLFDEDAFNHVFFLPPGVTKATAERIELGRLLFFDPILSGNNERSCGSCHRPEQGFTDGLPKSIAYGFNGTTQRNAPTLINAGLQPSSSYDFTTLSLEDRVAAVLHNELELNTTFPETVAKLRNSPEYMDRFEVAFGSDQDDMTVAENLKIAISDYIRSLEGMNSEFDKYLRGEIHDIDEAAKRGFNLFMGKALCGTCHFMPLYNGVVPPSYEDHEAEIIGVPEQPDTLNATVDPDPGRYILYKYDLHKFSFKTPTVRNAQLTAPYMHNGVYETLLDVVDFYNRGGGAGIGIDLTFQTLPTDPLNLTNSELSDLVVFMESLTDTTHLTTRPTALPEVLDPNTNAPINRVIGGVY